MKTLKLSKEQEANLREALVVAIADTENQVRESRLFLERNPDHAARIGKGVDAGIAKFKKELRGFMLLLETLDATPEDP